MADNQPADQKQWYVMRAYKSERKAEELLGGKHGLCYYIPKKTVARTRLGKKIFYKVPVIHSLVFVYATKQDILDFKRYVFNELQFVTWKTDGIQQYMIVPEKEMKNFITLCNQREQEVTFCRPEDICIEKGKRVRVHGGVFDGMEGHFVKVARKRGRRLVVIIPNILAASVEAEIDCLEILQEQSM